MRGPVVVANNNVGDARRTGRQVVDAHKVAIEQQRLCQYEST